MRRIFSVIAAMFRVLWRCLDWFRRSLANLVFLVLIVVILFAIFGRGRVAEVQAGALILAPTGDLTEQLAGIPAEMALKRLRGDPPTQLLVSDLVAMIDKAALDADVKMLVIKPDGLQRAELTKLRPVADAIKRFRDTGKTVIAYGSVLNQSQYYLASQANEISLDPMGMVLVRGFGIYPRYYKDALEKYGVDVNVFRVGEYKSAVEPFLRNDMSAEARRSSKQWLDSVWSAFLADVAQRRNLSPEALQAIVVGFPDQLKAANGNAAKVAIEAGLVDVLETPMEFRRRLETLVGRDDDADSFKQISYAGYLQATRREVSGKQHQASPDDNEGRVESADSEAPEMPPAGVVAVVTAVGSIMDGQQPPGTIGGETLAGLLAEVRKDDDIKAVVLRVDSPGGSVTGSEQVRREVVSLRSAGKPVVVSMGSYAASGGYWISMNADEIWAEPTTLTGSIGIFGLLPNLSPLLNRNGVHVDGVGTTPWAAGLRLDTPLPEGMKQGMQSMIEHGYHEFISKVANARNMSIEAVDKVARGRVWTGRTALELGLVDSLGGLNDALAAAKKLAGLKATAPERRVDTLQSKALQMLQQVNIGRLGTTGSALAALVSTLQSYGASTDARLLAMVRNELPEWLLGDPRGIYAHCFCDGEQ